MRNSSAEPTTPRLLAVALVGLLSSGAATAASLIPPSLSIRLPQNAVAVATLLEVVDAEHLRFRRDVVLQEDRALEQTGGQPPDEIVVRAPEGLVTSAEVGQQYVLGYTSLVEVPNTEHTYSPDPEGSEIVILPGVGPALFEETPELRRLATPRPTDAELSPRARLDLILGQLERSDPDGRLFVLAELVLWTELTDVLSDQDLARFQAVLESGELEARAREYYLRAFIPVREQVGEEWLLEECRRVLAQYDAELDLLSAEPSLVNMALISLREMGTPADGEAALAFLQSNNDSVSEAAFLTAAALAPDYTEEVVEKIVLVGDLPLDTERAAIRFLAERQAARRVAGDAD